MSAPSPPTTFDARLIPCSLKHAMIFRRWASLRIGESFVLLNDHRPEPLRRQFEQFMPDCFEWSEIEPPPDAFAVRLTRLRPDPAGFDPGLVNGCGLTPSNDADDDASILVQLQFDYRDQPSDEARERLLRVAARLPEEAALLADFAMPDPELDRRLTVLKLAFRGEARPKTSPGWRYTIRHPLIH